MPSLPVVRSGRIVVSLLGLAALVAGVLLAAGGSRAASSVADVFPVPDGHYSSPRTQISFRGVPADALGTVTVTGSRSGIHGGRIVADSDGDGASFLPAVPFRAGETVTVNAGVAIAVGSGDTYSFAIAEPAPAVPGAPAAAAPRSPGDVDHFASRRDLVPAAVTVTHRPSHAAAGDLFVAPQDGPYQQGPMIIGPYGGLIWFQPVPKGDSATDFRVQTYRGKPVLTWWQGAVSHAGTGSGEDEIYDSAYRRVATVKAGNGLHSDLHEFQLTPQGTALVSGYYSVYVPVPSGRTVRRRLVLDSVVQEIDIPTGNVLYEWDSLDHVGLAESHQPAPANPNHPWDYFHINSVQQDTDGNLVISSRDAWAAFKIDHATGAVIWQLGGRNSTFTMGRNAQFVFQHDVRVHPGGLVTVFDDGAGPPAVHHASRGETLRLDFTRHTATLVGQDVHPQPSLLAFYEGNDQLLPGGDQLVGWGQQPYLTEFDARGHVVFDARFVGANSTYRAYRFGWTGTPATPPAVASAVHGGHTTVYASWNGATALARWRVLAGARPTGLKGVGGGARGNFEATIALHGRERFVAVQALDARGHVLATSHVIPG